MKNQKLKNGLLYVLMTSAILIFILVYGIGILIPYLTFMNIIYSSIVIIGIVLTLSLIKNNDNLRVLLQSFFTGYLLILMGYGCFLLQDVIALETKGSVSIPREPLIFLIGAIGFGMHYIAFILIDRHNALTDSFRKHLKRLLRKKTAE